jgi:hypothetical protein
MPSRSIAPDRGVTRPDGKVNAPAASGLKVTGVTVGAAVFITCALPPVTEIVAPLGDTDMFRMSVGVPPLIEIVAEAGVKSIPFRTTALAPVTDTVAEAGDPTYGAITLGVPPVSVTVALVGLITVPGDD